MKTLQEELKENLQLLLRRCEDGKIKFKAFKLKVEECRKAVDRGLTTWESLEKSPQELRTFENNLLATEFHELILPWINDKEHKFDEKAQKEIEDLFKNEIEPRLEKAEVTFAKLKLTAGEFFELKRLFGKSDDQKPV